MDEYYHILGLPPNAPLALVKQSYRRLAMKYHPDRNPSDEAKEKFIEIQNAYDRLTDSNKKIHPDSNTEFRESDTPEKNPNKYKRSRQKRRFKEDFDPEQHVPNYVHSYVTTEDSDYFSLGRIFLLGIIGAVLTMVISFLSVEHLELDFVSTFLIASFLLFDLVLCMDLSLGVRSYHAFIVKITADSKKGLFSLYMSLDETYSSDFNLDAVRDSVRFRNYFYARELGFDYSKYPQMLLKRTPVFLICLTWVAHNKQGYKVLPFFKNKKSVILCHCYVLVPAGIALLFIQDLHIYPLYYIYFLYHFYFIRQYITSNRLN
ncbi:MAG TPA: J domain-containing protein [Cytophagales bacterium]|nr:J domain-containing protein [Cytophagales bacterium]